MILIAFLFIIPFFNCFPQIQEGGKLITGETGRFQFSESLELSADGTTLAAGGPYGPLNVGAVWIFIRSFGVWSLQAKLIGTDGVGSPYQGESVSLSANGDTLAVGGSLDNGTTGAVWIFIRSAFGVWSQQGSKLIGIASSGSKQGFSVSLSADGNTLAVGGLADGSPNEIGAVWIYIRSGGVWNQQGPKLIGTGNIGPSHQGSEVSLSSDGNTLAVGGEKDNSRVGATWIFTRAGGVWSQQGPKLVGTGWILFPEQGFHVSLNADGNTLAVGGHNDNTGVGATWIFTRAGGVWSQQGPKLIGTGAVGGGHQGISVSLNDDGNILAFGAFDDDSLKGATWIFTRDVSNNWTQRAKLIGSGNTGTAHQGYDVSLSGETLAISGDLDNSRIGAAWIFVNHTNAPTRAPTTFPTIAPTIEPTMAPTLRPTRAPTTSSPTNQPTTPAPTMPPSIECAGPWVPLQVPNGVSQFCSSCRDGTMLLGRSINTSDSRCLVYSNYMVISCSFVCLDNLTLSQVPNITSLLTTKNYFSNLLSSLGIFCLLFD